MTGSVPRQFPRKRPPERPWKRFLWAKNAARSRFPALRRRIIEHLRKEIQHFNRQFASLLTIALAPPILGCLAAASGHD
jgi:hypothetical protein